MIVSIDRTFEKDTDKIKDKDLLSKIADCIEDVRSATSSQTIKNLKKLKGGNHYFRIKTGDYRIGLVIEKDKVEFIRFLHRKDIYRYFP